MARNVVRCSSRATTVTSMKRLTLALLIIFTSFIATAGFDPNADRCVKWTWKWAADYKTRIVVCLEWKKAYKNDR